MSDEDLSVSLKMIMKGAGVVLFGMIFSKLMTYVFRILLARFYGPGDYGIFSLGLAVLGFFAMVGVMGIQSGITRYIAEYISKKNHSGARSVTRTAINIVLPLSMLMAAVMFIAADFIAINVFNEPELVIVIQILALSVPFSAILSVLVSSFIGFEKIEYQMLSESLANNTLKVAFLLLFGFMSLGVMGIALAWLMSAVVSVFIAVYFLKKIYRKMGSTKKSKCIYSRLIRFSLPLTITTSLAFIFLWTDTLMLGFFRNTVDVGIYNAALPTSQLLFIIPNALASLFLPIITGLYVKGNMKKVSDIYKTVTRWTFYANFPLFLLLLLFSDNILNIIFGSEYTSGYMALSILSIGFMAKKTVPAVSIIHMTEKTRYVFYIVLVGSLINVALNYILVPPYGMEGAAFSTAMTYIITSAMIIFVSYRLTKLNPFSFDMIKSLFAGIAALAVIYAAYTSFFIGAGIFVLALLSLVFFALYLIFLLLFKGLRGDDIEMINVIEKKFGFKLTFARKIIKKLI